MYKNYSSEEKKAVLTQFLSGISITGIFKNTGISRNTIYEWIRKESEKNKKTPKVNLRTISDLKKQCSQKDIMINILQNSPFITDVDLHKKFDYIKAMSNKYNVSILCNALNVSKGSYYNHILRNKNENNSYIKRRNELKEAIWEIYSSSKYTYGVKRIYAIMKERGYKTSTNMIARIQHENGWFAVSTSAKALYELHQNGEKNILDQNFEADKPNQKWVSDVTECKIDFKKYYICVILDLFSRKAISCSISEKNNTALVKNTFKKAYIERRPTNLLFHSDRGSNFMSKTFRLYLKSLSITQSFSDPGMPYNNSVMESFFKTLKKECLYIKDFQSEKAMRKATYDFIYFYNNLRHHSFLNNKTPVKFEMEYIQKCEKNKNNVLNNNGSDC